MKIWQRYITNQLVKIQERTAVLTARDQSIGASIIKQDRFFDLRELMREDLTKVQFTFRSGLRTLHDLRDLFETYSAAIIVEHTLQDAKNRLYLTCDLGPRFAEYGYEALSTPLHNMMFSIRKPDGQIVSFPRGEIGVYQCEKLLASLTGESLPRYNAKQVRERVESFSASTYDSHTSEITDCDESQNLETTSTQN